MLRFKKSDGSSYPEWRKSSVLESCSFTNGKAHENNIDEDGEYIVVNSKFISSDGTVRKYSNTQIEPLYQDDIVFVMSDVPNGKAIAKCYLIDENGKYTLNQRICALRTKENSYFLMTQINRNKYYLRFDDGVKQTNLRKEDVLNCPLFLPCSEEQKRIADCLSSVDEVIFTIESEVALWKEKKKGVMQNLFSQKVKFKKENGSDYPDWEEQEIGNLGEFIKGAPLSKADISETGTSFILYGELYTTYNEVAYEIKRKTKAIVDDKYHSKMGDVVIPTSGESAEEISTATCVMKEGVILAGDLNIFRSDIVDGRIMSYILNCQAKNKIAKIAQGKSIVHIQAKELGKVKIQYPTDSEEQEKIAELLFAVDEVIQIKQQKLEKWKNIKKGLLQQMFV